MDARALREFLEKVKSGETSVEEAARRLAELPVQRVSDFAQLDGERALRMGVPEVFVGER
jgi:NCAIR mutase (PurE)-related protein